MLECIYVQFYKKFSLARIQKQREKKFFRQPHFFVVFETQLREIFHKIAHIFLYMCNSCTLYVTLIGHGLFFLQTRNSYIVEKALLNSSIFAYFMVKIDFKICWIKEDEKKNC